MRNIISARNFSKEDIIALLEKASRVRQILKDCLNSNELQFLRSKLAGRIMLQLFFEPSTRTDLSFELAGINLGMNVISRTTANLSTSVAKGESVKDMLEVISSYGNIHVLVMRHSTRGILDDLPRIVNMRIINAGDGFGEHPTQAVVDLFTIWKHRGKKVGVIGSLGDLRIVFVGDLARSRTVRSLVYLLCHFPRVQMSFVAPIGYGAPPDVIAHLVSTKMTFEETTNLRAALIGADVVYTTRYRREYDTTSGGYADLMLPYVITDKHTLLLPENAILIDPMPIVDQISEEVYKDPRAVFIEQASYGVPVRMALLEYIFEQEV